MPATTTKPVTGPDWAVAILQAIGAPVTTNNIQNLEQWAVSEGGLGDPNNPFNAGGQHPGATQCIAQCGTLAPIYAYATIQDGVNANVANLKNGYYPNILAALRSNAPYTEFAEAVNVSPWGTHDWPQPIDTPAQLKAKLGKNYSGGGGGTTGTTPPVTGAVCLPGASSLPLIGSKFCIQRTTLEKVLGGALMVGGVAVVVVGVLIVTKGAVPRVFAGAANKAKGTLTGAAAGGVEGGPAGAAAGALAEFFGSSGRKVKAASDKKATSAATTQARADREKAKDVKKQALAGKPTDQATKAQWRSEGFPGDTPGRNGRPATPKPAMATPGTKTPTAATRRKIRVGATP